MVKRGQVSSLAQFYGIVAPSLILTKHIFKGLRRSLYCDKNMNGDATKLIHSRRPKFDYEWRRGAQGDIAILPAPENNVFVTIMSRNIKHKEEYPSVYAWIEKWNWVPEDSYLPEAPVNFTSRYDEKIYTREGG